VTRKMYRESLQNNRERILMSKKLATIDCNVPVPFELESLRTREPDIEQLKPLYKELEFFSHLKELGPSEDERPRDFAALADQGALIRFVSTGSPSRPRSPSHFRRTSANSASRAAPAKLARFPRLASRSSGPTSKIRRCPKLRPI
jgi:hypothetical protein